MAPRLNSPDAVAGIAYDGASDTIELRGPAAQLLELDGLGSKTVAWQPVDRRAMDIEIRARVFAVKTVPFGWEMGAPFVRWSTETSHGNHVWTDPPLMFPVAQTQVESGYQFDQRQRLQWNLMPARGISFRVTTREFKLELRNEGFYGRGPYNGPADIAAYGVAKLPSVAIAISFQPVAGLETSVYPFVNGYDNSEPDGDYDGNCMVYPTEAKEWRVRQPDGTPFVLDAASTAINPAVNVLGLVGDRQSSPYMHQVTEWTPIPFGGWGFYSEPDPYGSAFMVEFR